MDLSSLSELAPPFLGRLPLIRAIVWFIIIFILPGLAWTFFFFKKMNIVWRLTLAFFLSIAVAVLSVVVLHVIFGVRITEFNSMITIVAIVAVPLAFSYLKKLIGRCSSGGS